MSSESSPICGSAGELPESHPDLRAGCVVVTGQLFAEVLGQGVLFPRRALSLVHRPDQRTARPQTVRGHVSGFPGESTVAILNCSLQRQMALFDFWNVPLAVLSAASFAASYSLKTEERLPGWIDHKTTRTSRFVWLKAKDNMPRTLDVFFPVSETYIWPLSFVSCRIRENAN